MNIKTMSFSNKDNSKWFIINAEGHNLGRLASKIVNILRGKNQANFTPHADLGDNLIVINAAKIKVTGAKLQQKIYYSHSGYIGGLKSISYQNLVIKDATKPLIKAVKGMLPKNKLSDKIIKRLRVFGDENHDLIAQNPQLVTI